MARHLWHFSVVKTLLGYGLVGLGVLGFLPANVLAQDFSVERIQQATLGGQSESSSFTLYSSAGSVSPSGEMSRGAYSVVSGGRLVVQEPIARLAIIHSPAAMADEQSDLRVIGDVDATFGIRESVLQYRRGGDAEFTGVIMDRTAPDRFEATIPGSAVTSRGIAYFMQVTDSTGRMARGPLSGFHAVVVRVGEPGRELDEPLPGGTDQQAYRLVSVPLDLDDKDPQAVLADDFGSYEPSDWRFFEMAFDQELNEYPNTSEMALGTAFWLIAREEGRRFDTGQGVSARLDQRYAIALHPRWNLIGNPFDFPVPAANVTLGSGEAFELRAYEGGWNNPIRDQVTALQPFSGYAVFNPSAIVDTLYVNPNMQTVQNATMNKHVAAKGSGVGWAVQISAHDRTGRDADNVAAVAGEADTGWDAMDHPEPPMMGAALSAYFPHPEWGRLSEHYSTDVRPSTLDGHEWRFEVRSTDAEPVRLRFDGIPEVPADYEVWLIDGFLEQPKDLRADPSYSFNPVGVNSTRKFRLVVGGRTFLDRQLDGMQVVPTTLELLPVFPNPFGTSSTIRYALPQPTHVTVRVFNVAGNLVAVLTDRTQSEGFHSLVWDGHGMQGNPLPNGLYFVRMQAGETSLGRTVVLVR